MAGWAHHTGLAIAYPHENVDTDQLIPARFMSVPRKDGYGPYLLHDQRFNSTGQPIADMVLNRHPECTVLIARRNFGTGSSREAAVYALLDFGIRAVIAPSFGDIFASNAVNNGLLPARLTAGKIEQLIAALGDGVSPAQIDLETGNLTVAEMACSFDLDPVWRTKLINGWDDIDLTSNHANQIAAFQRKRRKAYPWAWPRRF